MTHCLRVGVGGPVGSGKTALLRQLCTALRDHYDIAVVTNDIYTREDADFLLRHEALAADRSWVWKPAAARIPPFARMPP